MKYRSEQRGALLDGHDPEYGFDMPAIRTDGILHIPADFLAIAAIPTSDKSEKACILIRRGGMGMVIGLTPATMREYAKTLTRIADRQEASAAVAAKVALKKAAGQ